MGTIKIKFRTDSVGSPFKSGEKALARKAVTD
jgi:hypothetical protein